MGPLTDPAIANTAQQTRSGEELRPTASDTTERSIWRAATVAVDRPEAFDAVAPDDAVALGGGRYQVREVLGIGGMGEVRLCRDEAIGRDVALKTLLDARQASASAQRRFLREVTAALALDPDNAEARTLLVRLFVETPSRMPPEVEAEINTATHQSRMGLLRFGSYALACWLLTVPVVLGIGVRSWPPVLLSTLLCVASFLHARWIHRRSDLSLGSVAIVTGLTFATLASVGCWMGPFVLVPQASAIVTLWITLHSQTRRERWMLIAMGVLSVTVPFLLELAGVFPPSYVFADGNITIVARALRLTPNTTLPMLLYCTVAFVALPAIFLGRMRDVLSAAERQLFLQAWHLRKLLPEGPARE